MVNFKQRGAALQAKELLCLLYQLLQPYTCTYKLRVPGNEYFSVKLLQIYYIGLICKSKVVSIPRNNEIYKNLDIPKTMSTKTFKGYERT